MIRIEKLVILGGQACDGQTTKIQKKNISGGKFRWETLGMVTTMILKAN